MLTFRVMGVLLQYPTRELVDALSELEDVLDREGMIARKDRRALRRLFALLRESELMALQEFYVDLFDRVRSLSLNLFEHVHGESRDRGQAMVELNKLYQRRGLRLAPNELPDFLPAFLEYLSLVTQDEAHELLVDSAHIFELLGARLEKRGSPYCAVFHALMALSGKTSYPTVIDESEIRCEDDPATMDRLWQEEPAFGPRPEHGQVSAVRFYKRAAT